MYVIVLSMPAYRYSANNANRIFTHLPESMYI